MTADSRDKLTPPEVARRWGVAPETVISWIRSGELKAIDVSARPGIGRPRYRIDSNSRRGAKPGKTGGVADGFS